MSITRILVVLLSLTAVAAVVATAGTFCGQTSDSASIPISEVIAKAQRNEISSIEVRGDRLTVHTKLGSEFKSRKEDDTSIVTVLTDAGVRSEERTVSSSR